MVLIEREAVLTALDEVLAATRAGGGRLVLVPGEAGAGKTTAVRAFLSRPPEQVVRLVGACDSLRTPRPLGGLLDWAHEADPALAAAITTGAAREQVFARTLALLSRDVTVAVLEDVHWADEATLDLVAFLARRLDRTRAALLLTYRDDEVVPPHPLATVLGELATVRPVRVPIPALSPAGVESLVGERDVDAAQLHARTGGNAFFVTECLSADDAPLPLSVRDIVLARAGRLSPAARAALDAVATVPGRAELWLAEALGATGTALDECVAHGLLVAEPGHVRFRHELAREAVHAQLPPALRRRLHQQALAVLQAPPHDSPDPSRVAHHAVEAGDVAAILRHAPAAATAAEKAGARREAVAHLDLALQHAGSLEPAERLELWSRLAEQLSVLGRHAAALDAYERALALAVDIGDEERQGALLTRMWNPLSMVGELERAAQAVTRAVVLLEARPPGPALALAYAQRCAQHMLARELPAAEPWGQAAIRLATEQGDDEVLAYALIQSGIAQWMRGDPAGLDRLRRGIAVATARGLPRLVAQGLSQIGSGGGEVRRYDEAVPALEECVGFAERYELGSRGLYAAAWLARCHLDLGRWDEAATRLSEVLRSPRCDGITRLTALGTLGRLRARRGDPDVWRPLDEALALALRTGHLQRLWPVAAARAEAAQARGHLDAEVDLLADVFADARRLEHPWAVGELGYWLHRAGAHVETAGAAEPYALHLAGRLSAAAQAWEELGCVYERAVALAESADDEDQRTALAVFEQLGARPAAARLVEQRRAAGLSVPRGPNAATRGNPGGLTDRQLDVLRLVAAGCSNREIGARLHISTKTASHHVSHVLAKLGSRSRAEAVAAAVAAGVALDPGVGGEGKGLRRS